MTGFVYSPVGSVLLLVGFVVIVSREWIVGFCIHLLISFFSLDSSGFRGGLPLVALVIADFKKMKEKNATVSKLALAAAKASNVLEVDTEEKKVRRTMSGP